MGANTDQMGISQVNAGQTQVSTSNTQVSTSQAQANTNQMDVGQTAGQTRDMVPYTGGPVDPILSVEEAQSSWETYRKMENTLLSEEDYIYFAKWETAGKANMKAFPSREEAEALAKRNRGVVVRRKTKTAYRKMARFFGLTLPRQDRPPETTVMQLGNKIVKIQRWDGVSSTIYMDEDLNTIKAEHEVTVVHSRTGTTMVGIGACSINEGRGFKHPDHDIVSTSLTRALNRAISDIVGWGEVSAEELQDGDEASGGGGASSDYTMATFLSDARNKLGYSFSQLEKIFGDLSKIENYSEAYIRLAEEKIKQEES